MSKIFENILEEVNSSHRGMQVWISAKFAKTVEDEMKKQNVSRSELARRLGMSPAYITKILFGDANHTIETMSKIAFALNCELSEIKLKNKKGEIFNLREVQDFQSVTISLESEASNEIGGNSEIPIAA